MTQTYGQPWGPVLLGLTLTSRLESNVMAITTFSRPAWLLALGATACLVLMLGATTGFAALI